LSFDSLSLKIISLEIASEVIGRTIDRIVEPRIGEFAFILRNENSSSALYISFNPSNPFVFHSMVNTARFSGLRSNYSLQLKKFLDGARIEKFVTLNDDRILLIVLRNKDQFSERRFSLFFEFMGKHSNSFIVSGEYPDIAEDRASVLAAVSESDNLINFIVRPVKKPVSACDASRFENEWRECADKKTLMEKYCGLSPALISAAGPAGGAAVHALHSCSSATGHAAAAAIYGLNYDPAVYVKKDPGKNAAEADAKYFAYHLLLPAGSISRRFERLNDSYEYLFGLYNRRALTAPIISVISRLKNSARKKYDSIRQEYDSSASYENHLTYGKAIIALLPRASESQDPRGRDSIETESGKIPLDARFSLSDNAQIHFKLYKRLRSKYEHALKMMGFLEKKLKDLSGCADELSAWVSDGSASGINEIEKKVSTALADLVTEKRTRKKLLTELSGGVGAISSQLGVRPAKKKNNSGDGKMFRKFESSGGLEIYVGRSDEGNDFILSRIASQEDYWLHVKDFRGSSVILKTPKGTGDEIVEESIAEAALYAAHYSQGRNATRIFVSCAKRKHVKKIKRAIGKVTYENERSILVDVDRLTDFFGPAES